MTPREIWTAVSTPHEAESTDPYVIALRQLTWSIDDFKIVLASALLPAVQEMADNFARLCAAMREAGMTIDA